MIIYEVHAAGNESSEGDDLSYHSSLAAAQKRYNAIVRELKEQVKEEEAYRNSTDFDPEAIPSEHSTSDFLHLTRWTLCERMRKKALMIAVLNRKGFLDNSECLQRYEPQRS